MMLILRNLNEGIGIVQSRCPLFIMRQTYINRLRACVTFGHVRHVAYIQQPGVAVLPGDR